MRPLFPVRPHTVLQQKFQNRAVHVHPTRPAIRRAGFLGEKLNQFYFFEEYKERFEAQPEKIRTDKVFPELDNGDFMFAASAIGRAGGAR